jgi:glutathione S-transferase
MKLYYFPGACSLGIHVLLEEAGAVYETALVDFTKGEQNGAAYLAVNPKGKVPAVALDEGGVLTEWPAIAAWIAAEYPAAKLVPAAPLAAARVLEMVAYVNSTVHSQGFARMVRSGAFAPNPEDKEAVKARGKEIFAEGFELIAKALGDGPFVAGAEFSIADAALFYVEQWAKVTKQPLPAVIEAHYERMLARPAVGRVMAAEGLA